MNMKSPVLKLAAVACVSLALSFIPAAPANAEGFTMHAWGARGTALAGGMVGRADDPSAVAHNPAGITQLPGMRMLSGVTFILPQGKVDTELPTGTVTTKADRHHWAAPHAFFTQQINDEWWWGVGIYNRFGLGNTFPKTWPGAMNLQEVLLQLTSVTPCLAWKVNDNLSVAIGVEFMYGHSRIGHTYDMGALTHELINGLNSQRMKGNGHAWGGNIALHYKFNDQWQAGLTYRFPVHMKLNGKNKWDVQYGKHPMYGNMFHVMQDGDVHATFRMPDSISFGLTWKPMPNLSLEAGTIYTLWQRFHSLYLTLESPVDRTEGTRKEWKNAWTFNGSVEYWPLEWLALRLGYSFQTSPMKVRTVDYMVPTDEYHRIGAGVGFKWDRWTLDLAYGFVYVTELRYEGIADNTFKGEAHGVRAHEAAISLGYRF